MFFQNLGIKFFQFLYYFIARHFPASYSLSFIGRFSKRFRAFCCKNIFHAIGKNVNIEKGAYFGSGRQIVIGDYSGIGVNCSVPSNIHIGKDVMMGPDVLIINQNQNHRIDSISIPMRLQGHQDTLPVVIEDDVWLGARVIVLPGVKIGKGSVIGAGSIVTKDIPEYAISVGNPARIVRYRNDQL